VAAALEEGRAIKLWILQGSGGAAVADIVRRARENRIVFQWVDHRRMGELAPDASHQGVAARVSPHRYQTLDDLWDRGSPSPLLVLDGITDPHNLGAIVRNAAFFGAGGVIIPRWRAAGITGVVEKASAGTLGLIPLVQVPSAAHTLLELKERGYWIYGADAAGLPVPRVSFGEPTALVIGAEGEGLHRLVRERCDALVSVPGAGQVASLNASCACAALLYEIARGRGEETALNSGTERKP
jgi:23S rRNA (guanosine2251-2'-O)-methyltransferase